MNVVIYARFSSHSQTKQSIKGQLKVCYEYAESHNYTVVGNISTEHKAENLITVPNFKG